MTQSHEPAAQPVAAEDRLDLLPDPGAVREAREWAGRMLGGWADERLETARLLVSELVTNVVLHARTPMSLRHLRVGTRARFELADGLRAGPVAKRYVPDSPTGRGIRLVTALADDWGVQRSIDGKVVWFELEPSERTGSAELGSVFLLHVEGLSVPPVGGDDQSAAGEDLAGGGGTPEADAATAADDVEIQFLGLPIETYLEMGEHNDAVMRELEMIIQSSHNPGSVELPRRLVELASQARTTFAPAAERVRSQVDEVIARGDAAIDLRVRVPLAGWETLLELGHQLNELDRFCEEGDLLTLASPSRIRQLRAWFVHELEVQMRGEPPTPWSE